MIEIENYLYQKGERVLLLLSVLPFARTIWGYYLGVLFGGTSPNHNLPMFLIPVNRKFSLVSNMTTSCFC